MIKLDDCYYPDIETTAKKNNMDKRTLENHLNKGPWRSKKGVLHLAEEYPDDPTVLPVATEDPVATDDVATDDVATTDSVCYTFDVPTLDRLVKVAKPEQVLRMPSLHRKKKSGVGHYAKLGNPLYRNK